MATAHSTQKSIAVSTGLVLVATLLAGLAGSIMLSNYYHRNFHNGIVRTAAAQAQQFQGLVDEHLLASTKAFDAMDKAAIEQAWHDGTENFVLQRELNRLRPLAAKANIAAIAINARDGQLLAAIGSAQHPPADNVPLNSNHHLLLYWNDGWWLEHRVDIVSGGVAMAEWVAQIELADFRRYITPPVLAIPGAVLALCALTDAEYPCLSMPPPGQRPAFYLGENGYCLAPNCEGGLHDEEFTRTHGMVAAYQAIEGMDIVAVYSVPLADFFREEQWYERVAIAAVLAVALSGLWAVYLQMRPIARDLARTTSHMREIMRQLPESVITIDEAGVIRTANAATSWMFGYDSGELVGRNVNVLVPAPQGYSYDALPADGRNGYHQLLREVTARHRDGSLFPAELLLGEYRFDNEHHLIGIVRDISQRKLNEEALRKWAHIFENAEWGIAVSSAGSLRLELMNPAFARLHGYSVEELTGRPIGELFAPPCCDEVEQAMRIAHDRGHYAWEAPHRRRDGSTFIGLMDITAVKDAAGRVMYRVLNIRDITESKQREAELERQRLQLAELAANRETVREQERTRIAREIHDELGQSLTTLRMQTALLGIGIGPNDPQRSAQIDEMKGLIDQTIQVVRNVATKLRPGALDLGIGSAIEWLAQDFEERTGILCGLDIDPDIELEDERATMVFRILQESLTNVARHAQAAHVEIAFLARGGGYWLEVSDDGCGFDSEAEPQRKTFGLLGIRERAAVLGGEVTIASTPGHGTILKLHIPA